MLKIASKYSKKLIVLTLVVMIVMTTGLSHANKVFTDVSANHWAKEHIDKMNSLGIITGYGDNTFRPLVNVPVSQAIVMMVRMINPPPEDIDTALGIYEDLLLEVGVESWAQREVAYALLKGIISERELRGSYENKVVRTAEKLEICRYLTRALGLEEKARSKETVTLVFNDRNQIPATDAFYVDMMIDIGVIDKHGDSNGNFNPKDPMNRAIMSKILSVAYDHMEEKRQEELAKRNKNIVGVVEAINFNPSPMLIIKDNSNAIHEHLLDLNVKVTKNTVSSSLLDLKVGDKVETKLVDNIISAIDVKTSTPNVIEDMEVEGTIISILITNKVEINIRDAKGVDKAYRVSPHLVTLLDRQNSSLINLRVGYSVKLTLQNGEVIVIFAETKEVSDRYTGVVEFIDKDLEAFIVRPEGKSPIRIDTTKDTTYVNTVDSESTFRAVNLMRKVTVIGKYENGKFIANTVVITE